MRGKQSHSDHESGDSEWCVFSTDLVPSYLGRRVDLEDGPLNEADSFMAGTQTRASRARKSSVTHKSAITDHAVEENHVIDWDKAKVVDREAQRQTRWIKEALWIRKTPMCMNRDAGSYQHSHTLDQVISRSRAPLRCKQSRRDQDVWRTSKRCH